MQEIKQYRQSPTCIIGSAFSYIFQQCILMYWQLKNTLYPNSTSLFI